MTPEELYEDRLNAHRGFRNQKLEQTDIIMNQTDRFTAEQLIELQNYRQSLRDYINCNLNEIKSNIAPPFPAIPAFIAPIIKRYKNPENLKNIN